jgi:hypothetical protein
VAAALAALVTQMALAALAAVALAAVALRQGLAEEAASARGPALLSSPQSPSLRRRHWRQRPSPLG